MAPASHVNNPRHFSISGLGNQAGTKGALPLCRHLACVWVTTLLPLGRAGMALCTRTMGLLGRRGVAGFPVGMDIPYKYC